MVTREDLKKIAILIYLTGPMLDNLAEIIDTLKFDRDELLFRENEPADRFYMVRSGNVLLEQTISDKVSAYVGSIKPGYAFGWSAMIEDGLYTANAICAEPSEIYSFKRDRIQKLFAKDPEMGLRIYERLLVILKKRLDYRTGQFRQAIKNHPDMQHLFSS